MPKRGTDGRHGFESRQPTKNEIKKHEANEYKIISVEDQDIANAYYREWIYLVINKPEEAYKMLGSKSKKEYDTFEEYEEACELYEQN